MQNKNSNIKHLSFDLDGTLALSKMPIDQEMAELFHQILRDRTISVISGGNYDRFHTQIVERLSPDTNFKNLYLLPTTGAKFYYFDGNEWVKKYSMDLSKEQKDHIFDVFNRAINELNLTPEKTYGDLIEDRDTQVTYSALGQETPLEIKSVWDPDKAKRLKIVDYIKNKMNELKDFNVNVAGASSIDVTQSGVDKGFAMRKVMEILNLNKDEIIFFGDMLMEGGNDFPVTKTDVSCVIVKDHEDTKAKLREFLVSGK